MGLFPFNGQIQINAPAIQDAKSGVFEDGVWRPYHDFTELRANPELMDYLSLAQIVYVMVAAKMVEFILRDDLNTWRRTQKQLDIYPLLSSLTSAFNNTDPVAHPESTPETGLRAWVGNSAITEYYYNGLTGEWIANGGAKFRSGFECDTKGAFPWIDGYVVNTADDLVDFIVLAFKKRQAAPTVSAGSDASIDLPNTIPLIGNATPDGSGSITSHVWVKFSGPGTAVINSPTSYSTFATVTVEGVYVFKLNATDNLSQTASASVTKTLNYVLPVITPGSNPGLTLPAHTGTLAATVAPGSYALDSAAPKRFSVVSGGGTIDAVTGAYDVPASVGDNVLRVTGKDVNGRTSTRDITIAVSAAAVVADIGWYPVDKYDDLQTADTLTYQRQYTLPSNNADILADLHDMDAFYMPVIRIPTGQIVKNYYEDSGNAYNSDVIPGDNARIFTIRGFDYITFQYPQNFDTNSASRVKFTHH